MTELLLVGAGHAHLYVVNNAAALAAAGYRVHLLSPRHFHYSGLASAIVGGAATAEEGRVDVAALARRSGVVHHEGTLESVDLVRRVALTMDGAEISYDVLSLNIGSVVAPAGMIVDPAVVRVKPLQSLGALDERLSSVPGDGARVTVVGGGSTGLEIAAHLAVRPGVTLVQLLEAGPHLGADLPSRARRGVERLLAERGVVVRTGCAVTQLGGATARCADGTDLAHDVAVLATGLAAPQLIGRLGLGDEAGVPVRETLQHVQHDEIYALGDCANFVSQPLPRIGVHGVRQGPVLLASLLARTVSEPLPTYQPQRRALAVLDLGAGTALATWGSLWWQGPAALALKRRIDRRWLRRYQGS